jgi:hypothetical protein
MTNGYRKAITDRIKESVNNWIETLKKEQPELLLTKSSGKFSFQKALVKDLTV